MFLDVLPHCWPRISMKHNDIPEGWNGWDRFLRVFFGNDIRCLSPGRVPILILDAKRRHLVFLSTAVKILSLFLLFSLFLCELAYCCSMKAEQKRLTPHSENVRMRCEPLFSCPPPIRVSALAGYAVLVCEQRIVLHCSVYLFANGLDDLFVLGVLEHLVYQVGNEEHHVFLGATCCHGRCAQADA